MAEKGLIERSTIEGFVAETKRLSGSNDAMTPKRALAVLADTSSEGATYLLITPDGEEIPAVLVEEETVFDATENDIRSGKTAVTDNGVTVGTLVIPSYNTVEGVKVVPAGSDFSVTPARAELYDYTKFQAIICLFNTSLSDSVSAEKVAINDNVYDVKSTVSISLLTKNAPTIEFGIKNTLGVPCLIRYFTYKEIY